MLSLLVVGERERPLDVCIQIILPGQHALISGKTPVPPEFTSNPKGVEIAPEVLGIPYWGRSLKSPSPLLPNPVVML